MSRTILTFLGVAALLVVGCVRSLNPVYREQDIVFEPGVIGTWGPPDSSERNVITAGGDQRTYAVTHTDDSGKTSRFACTLMRREGLTLLDVHPADIGSLDETLQGAYFVPVHTFMVVEQIEPTIVLRQLENRWFEQLLRDHPDAIKHEAVDDTFIISAGTDEVFAFIKSHINTPEAWTDPTSLVRVDDATTRPATRPVDPR